MKALKVFGIFTLLMISGQSFANTVPIKFAKGSECGIFSGYVAGKKFTLQLGARQILNISTEDSDIQITVKDPKGRILSTFEEYDETQFGGEFQALYHTTTKGQYTILLKPTHKGAYHNIEFCAFNKQ